MIIHYMAKPLLSPPDSIIISYLTLRKIIGFLGIGLVPVIIIGTFFTDHTHSVYISISAYYYSGMRNEFEGIICGIALFLLSYHGYAWIDSLASKLAGLFALGIAFFPTSQSNDKSDITSTLHYVFAAIFFAILACMSIFLFTKTNKPVITPEKKKRNRIYRICGIVILVCVAGIPVLGIPSIHQHIAFIKPTLILETFTLTAFGFSWLTKGEFLLKDK